MAIGTTPIGANENNSIPPAEPPPVTTGTISLTQLTNKRVYQRNGNSRVMTFSGVYTVTSGTLTSIEGRLIDFNTGLPIAGHDWSVWDAAPTGGTFSVNYTVPQGGMYKREVRFSNAPTVSYTDANHFGVGPTGALIAQSNGWYWFNDSAGTEVASPNVKQYGSSWWEFFANDNAAKVFCNELETLTGCPVGLTQNAVSSTAMRQEADTGAGYWTNPAQGALSDVLLDRIVSGLGNECEFLLVIQGENDAGSGVVTAAEYASSDPLDPGLGHLITGMFRSVITNSSAKTQIPVIISQHGRATAYTDAGVMEIRNAQKLVEAAIPEVYLVDTIDLPLRDTVHRSTAGHVTEAYRMAKATAVAMGDQTTYKGPTISATALNGNVITVTVTHDAGADITPTTGITGFEVFDDNGAVTVSSVDRTSATTFDITTTGTLTGSVTIRYQWGMNPDISGAIFDNLGNPLRWEDTITVGDVIAPPPPNPVVNYTVSGTAQKAGLTMTFNVDLTEI